MAQTTLRNYLQETEDAISSGRVDDAFSRCQHILASFPELLEGQRLLGEVYLAQGKLEEAQYAFDWVLTNDPENVIAYCDRALISERTSDYDTALDCYQQAYELSRGNAQIRQEFNKLSAKIGQQGFMLSRAGLARLYMRGDLLLQAVQEWDNVFLANPDRLDVRTGLLETYWRESFYEQVEQLAMQILQDVPHCLKALLLLAHVTSTKNMTRAQELLKQAEALDPDLVMAQEFFAPLIASQPTDAFLRLLKKSPAALNTSNGVGTTPTMADIGSMPTMVNETTLIASEPMKIPEAHHDFPSWAGTQIWGSESDRTLIPSQQADAQRRQEISSLAAQLGNPALSADAWRSLGLERKEDVAAQVEASGQEPWQMWQEPQKDVPSLLQTEAASWDVLDNTSSSDLAGVDIWGESQEVPAVGDSQTTMWGGSSASETTSSSPAWLSMLTQKERMQMSGNISSVLPSEKKTSVEHPVDSVSAAVIPMPDTSSVQEAQSIPVASSSFIEEEEPLFGPEWLKSLGATSINAASSSKLKAVSSPAVSTPPPASLPSEHQQPAQQNLSGSLGADPVEREQNVMDTLEELEKSLAAQGFVGLEPNSLSAIAQRQAIIPRQPSSQGVSTPENSQDYQFSSAQAELDHSSEPTWIAKLRSQTMPEEREEATLEPTLHPLAVPTHLETDTQEETVHFPPAPRAVFDPFATSNLLFPGGLETTMRRPAIRLLPSLPPGQRSQSSLSAKIRAVEHKAMGKGAESNLNYQQRLVKGYQNQLAGDYDDAMQEYRLVIKGSPELLGEVVSNVRALLKLAPNYAAGYRVLGDVYMRQGEYLQAMESYNKALSMAKKIKS